MPAEAVSNKVLPLQNVVPAELMVGTIGVLLVTVTGIETAEHPEAFVTVTVNVPVFDVLIL